MEDKQTIKSVYIHMRRRERLSADSAQGL